MRYWDDGPVGKDCHLEVKKIARALIASGECDGCHSSADLMKHVIGLQWEPFRLEDHLVKDYPIPLPAPEIFPPPPGGEDDSLLSPLPMHSGPGTYVSYCDGIRECRSEERGRYMVASRDLKPGETLLREKAFAHIINEKHSKLFCGNCVMYPIPEPQLIRCHDCKSIVWCSETCRDASMRLYHRYECASMKYITSIFKADHYYMAMRMVIRGWRNLLYKLLTGSSLGEAAAAPDEFDLLENRDKISFEKFVEAGVTAKVFLWLLKAGGFVNQLVGHIAQRHEIASHQDAAELHQCVERFVGGTLLAHWVRIQCNAFQLNAQVVMKREHHPMHAEAPVYFPQKTIGFGTALFLKVSQINHSCRPNCDFYFTEKDQNVHTIEEIKEGEEIFITYERLARIFWEKEDRSLHVARHYGFHCFCKHCNTPGLDLCELYQQEESVPIETKSKMANLVDQTEHLTESLKIEEALKDLFELKKTCLEERMYWTASDVDDKISDCYGMLGNVFMQSIF